MDFCKICIIPGLRPKGFKSLRYSMKISFLSQRFSRISVTLFSIWIRLFIFSGSKANYIQRIPPTNINYADFVLPFELLYRDVNSLEVSNWIQSLSEIGWEILFFHHARTLVKVLRKYSPKWNLMHWKSFLKTRIL